MNIAMAKRVTATAANAIRIFVLLAMSRVRSRLCRLFRHILNVVASNPDLVNFVVASNPGLVNSCAGSCLTMKASTTSFVDRMALAIKESRQLGDVVRDASSLVHGEYLGNVSIGLTPDHSNRRATV